MASRRDRQQKTFEDREQFLKALASVDTVEEAMRLINSGKDAPYRSNAGYAVRNGMPPQCDASETQVYEALLSRLREKGYRWAREDGKETVLFGPDGKPIRIP